LYRNDLSLPALTEIVTIRLIGIVKIEYQPCKKGSANAAGMVKP
jgi:hypothetical protein